MLNEIQTRLEGQVPNLKGRVKGAAEFSDMMEKQTLPSGDEFAFIMSTEITADQPMAMAGAHIQSLKERFSVTLGFRNRKSPIPRAIDFYHTRIFEVIRALCGWAPAGISGVVELVRVGIAGFRQNICFYQVDFSIFTQLRITQ